MSLLKSVRSIYSKPWSLTKALLVPSMAFVLASCVDDGDTGTDGTKGDTGDPGSQTVFLDQIGRFHHTDQSASAWGESAAEIVAFSASAQRIFVVNGNDGQVDILDASDLTALSADGTLDLTNGGAFTDIGDPNSVAVSGDLVAVAVANDNKQADGFIYFFQTDGTFIKRVTAGALPDMVTFTPDGAYALSANEGEPSSDYQTDPEGSISIVAITNGVPADTATHATFTDYNTGGAKAADLPSGVRIFGNKGHTEIAVVTVGGGDDEEITVADGTQFTAGEWFTMGPDSSLGDAEGIAYQIDSIAVNVLTLTSGLDDEATYDGDAAEIMIHKHDGASTVAEDLEPEYIAISGDSATAYVSLQENNALAVVDIATATVTSIVDLGNKDHMIPGNELDVSNKDDRVNITNWPVRGLFMPDSIASYTVNGNTYLITANEGDARAYDGFSEEARFEDLNLDAGFPALGFDFSDGDNLGRIKTTITNDSDDDGDMDTNYVYGARSFSIWDSAGNLVFDSGSDFSVTTANRFGLGFNNTNSKTSDEDRSDDKGCEPEAVTVGKV